MAAGRRQHSAYTSLSFEIRAPSSPNELTMPVEIQEGFSIGAGARLDFAMCNRISWGFPGFRLASLQMAPLFFDRHSGRRFRFLK